MSGAHTSCFWALLSPEHFRFLYLPDSVGCIVVESGNTIKELLLHHSLLEFIHPEELEMAQKDLSNFKLCQTLAGSITRCRLKAFKDIRHQSQYYETDLLNYTWNVVDVVMYIATEDMILAFFHNSEYFKQPDRSMQQCGDKHFAFMEAKMMLKNLLDQGLPRTPMKRLPMDPIRLFQIHNAETRQLLVSWPSNICDEHKNPINNDSEAIWARASYEQTMEQLSKLAREVTNDTLLQRNDEQKTDSGQYKNDAPQIESDIACARHHQSTSIISMLGGLYRLERIVIPYGSIVFGAFHISKIPTVPRHENDTPTSYHSSRSYDFSSSSKYPQRLSRQQQQYHPQYQLYHSSWSIHELATPTNSERSRWHEGFEQDDPLLPVQPNRQYAVRRSLSQSTRAAPEIRICSKCHTSTSPEWRKGPSGNKTLCNACGLRFSRLVAKQKRIESKSSSSSSSGGH